jgi:DNA polymerase-1
LLYNTIGLPEQKSSKTKNISVDDTALENLKSQHQIVPLLQEYRGHHKIYSTYIEGTLEHSDHGRIYPSFNVNGTVTGRLAHSAPNMANLPKEGGVRGIYLAEDDHFLLSLDYSQLEVCIEANLTHDPNLVKIFLEGASKHDITAKELNVDRDTAKTLNFALQYWCSAWKVSQLLDVNAFEGQRIWNRYWEIYSGPKLLKEKTDQMVEAGTPIVSLFGRKRRFAPGKRPEWSGDYRQAYNFIIQSPGADITSRAFYLVDAALREKGWGKGLFTVHDELLLSVKKEHIVEAEALALKVMVGVGEELNLKYPLKAESSGGMERWND